MDGIAWKKHDMIPFDRNEKAFNAYLDKYMAITEEPLKELKVLKETFKIGSHEYNVLAKVLIQLKDHYNYCKDTRSINLKENI